MEGQLTDLNTSGFIPFDTRVIVKPDPTETKVGSILMPDAVTEKNKWAQTKATLIAAGCNAFRDWGVDAAKPAPNDRIVIGKYVGNTHIGADGQEYTVCNDEDVLALWRPK
jgi:co-chaperonin GroES (HSP10)